MTESHLDGLLDALVPAASTPRWDDVVDRARRGRRRSTVIVVVVVALVLAPATWAAVHAFEGTPATPQVHRAFVISNRLTAEASKKLGKEFPQAKVDEVHGVLQVHSPGWLLDLWAAPSTEGGTCFFLDWQREAAQSLLPSGTGGCLESRAPPLVAATFQGGPFRYAGLYGWARGPEATVRVVLTNGRTVTLPVVEHFFLGMVPSGIEPASLTGRDAHGHVVASWKAP